MRHKHSRLGCAGAGATWVARCQDGAHRPGRSGRPSGTLRRVADDHALAGSLLPPTARWRSSLATRMASSSAAEPVRESGSQAAPFSYPPAGRRICAVPGVSAGMPLTPSSGATPGGCHLASARAPAGRGKGTVARPFRPRTRWRIRLDGAWPSTGHPRRSQRFDLIEPARFARLFLRPMEALDPIGEARLADVDECPTGGINANNHSRRTRLS